VVGELASPHLMLGLRLREAPFFPIYRAPLLPRDISVGPTYMTSDSMNAHPPLFSRRARSGDLVPKPLLRLIVWSLYGEPTTNPHVPVLAPDNRHGCF